MINPIADRNDPIPECLQMHYMTRRCEHLWTDFAIVSTLFHRGNRNDFGEKNPCLREQYNLNV